MMIDDQKRQHINIREKIRRHASAASFAFCFPFCFVNNFFVHVFLARLLPVKKKKTVPIILMVAYHGP